MTTTKPDYVYVTYIATTPAKVWRAITDPEVARQYWMGAAAGPARVNVSDWRAGSRWEHQRADDPRAVDLVGYVVESTPPRRLMITWARPKDADDPTRHSRVTFDIESVHEALVKLTVTHDELAGDPPMLAGIASGWPHVLSNLKTLLETGRALPRPPG